jgi:hypothetical protein
MKQYALISVIPLTIESTSSLISLVGWRCSKVLSIFVEGRLSEGFLDQDGLHPLFIL